MPSGICKLNLGLHDSGYILAELLVPELLARLRKGGESATRMSVPEAPVYENHCPVFRKDDIRSSRKIAAVQAEAVAKPVEDLSNRQLRCSVPPLDRSHVTAAHWGDWNLI